SGAAGPAGKRSRSPRCPGRGRRRSAELLNVGCGAPPLLYSRGCPVRAACGPASLYAPARLLLPGPCEPPLLLDVREPAVLLGQRGQAVLVHDGGGAARSGAHL